MIDYHGFRYVLLYTDKEFLNLPFRKGYEFLSDVSGCYEINTISTYFDEEFVFISVQSIDKVRRFEFEQICDSLFDLTRIEILDEKEIVMLVPKSDEKSWNHYVTQSLINQRKLKILDDAIKIT